MLTLIIVLSVLAAVLVASAGFLVTGRRRRDIPAAPPRPEIRRPAEPSRPLVEAPPEPAGVEAPPAPEALEAPAVVEAPERVEAPPRFRDRLGRARELFSGYIGSVRSRGRIDESTWEELEEALILADVGVTLTNDLLEGLRARVKREGISDPDALVEALKAELIESLSGDTELHFANGDGTTV
ncbi:MAG TPA: signal recognition particle receptor subunit alpha, partial [Acidimicrobiales bacterium]|nr:signal recognition particle receptor subunit alpha [Acidimicrobiales bacterium]